MKGEQNKINLLVDLSLAVYQCWKWVVNMSYGRQWVSDVEVCIRIVQVPVSNVEVCIKSSSSTCAHLTLTWIIYSSLIPRKRTLLCRMDTVDYECMATGTLSSYQRSKRVRCISVYSCQTVSWVYNLRSCQSKMCWLQFKNWMLLLKKGFVLGMLLFSFSCLPGSSLK